MRVAPRVPRGRRRSRREPMLLRLVDSERLDDRSERRTSLRIRSACASGSPARRGQVHTASLPSGLLLAARRSDAECPRLRRLRPMCRKRGSAESFRGTSGVRSGGTQRARPPLRGPRRLRRTRAALAAPNRYLAAGSTMEIVTLTATCTSTMPTNSTRNGAGPVSSSPAPRRELPRQLGEGVVERLESPLTRNLEEQELPGGGLPDLDARTA